SLTETANIEPEPPVVKQKTIDYRWAECKTLAAFYHEGLNNPLFWLRTIECTSLTETANIEPEPPVVKQKTIDYRWAECKTLAA
ncbi:hypothetical protein BUE67_15865, partial [Corynebacterium diphtheriae]